MLTKTIVITERCQKARELAFWLMLEHGLSDWKFGFNNSRVHNAYCEFYAKRITLSTFYCDNNPLSMVRETILHEIAHAVTGVADHDDPVWQKKCREFGIEPNAERDSTMGIGEWLGECPTCGRYMHLYEESEEDDPENYLWQCYYCKSDQFFDVRKTGQLTAQPPQQGADAGSQQNRYG